MKKLFAVLFLLTIATQAQKNLSIGIIGSRFDNLGDATKLTKLNQPIGYGMVFGYHFDKNISFATTAEFLNENLNNNIGREKDFRFHVSAFLTPLEYKNLRGYLSTGFVFTNQRIDYSNFKDTNKNFFNGRFGFGLDYILFNNIFLNVDFGLYNDGLMLSGWSSSMGIRFIPNIF